MSSAPEDGPSPDDRAGEHDRSRHPHRQGPRTRRDEKGLADGPAGWSPGAIIAIVLVVAGVVLIIGLAVL